MPEELIGQAIKEVTMHEVGHTLGLRHNFKASTMLKNEQLHDTDITRKQGLVGSVMDYAPSTSPPRASSRATTSRRPRALRLLGHRVRLQAAAGGTEGECDELQEDRHASAPTPGHDYGTDEDLYGSADPLSTSGTWAPTR